MEKELEKNQLSEEEQKLLNASPLSREFVDLVRKKGQSDEGVIFLLENLTPLGWKVFSENHHHSFSEDVQKKIVLSNDLEKFKVCLKRWSFKLCEEAQALLFTLPDVLLLKEYIKSGRELHSDLLYNILREPRYKDCIPMYVAKHKLPETWEMAFLQEAPFALIKKYIHKYTDAFSGYNCQHQLLSRTYRRLFMCFVDSGKSLDETVQEFLVECNDKVLFKHYVSKNALCDEALFALCKSENPTLMKIYLRNLIDGMTSFSPSGYMA